MAGPITWRNLGGGMGGLGSLLSGGQNQIQQSLAGLANLARDYRQIEQQNAKALKDSNTQDYLDQVAAVGDASQLASPEVQAQLEATRQGFGNQIDRALTRNAAANRLSDLQKQAVQAGAYQDTQLEREQRPMIDKLYAAAAAGDAKGMNQVLDSTEFLNEGKLRSELMGMQDTLRGRELRDAAEGRAQRGEARAIENQAFNRENQEESRKDRRAFREQQEEDRNYKRNVQALDAIAQTADGIISSTAASNPFFNKSQNPQKDVNDIFAKSIESGEFDAWAGTDATSRERTLEQAKQLMTDGIKLTKDGETINVPVPKELMEQFLSTNKGRVYGYSGSAADYMKNYFTDMIRNNPEIGQRAFEGKQQRDAVNKLKSLIGSKKGELGSKNSIEVQDMLDQLQLLRQGVYTSPTPKPVRNLMPERE